MGFTRLPNGAVYGVFDDPPMCSESEKVKITEYVYAKTHHQKGGGKVSEKFLDLEYEFVKAADRVMELQDKVEGGLATEQDYADALVPFNEAALKVAVKRDRVAEFIMALEKESEHQKELAEKKVKRAKALANVAERIRNMVKYAFVSSGSKELKGNEWTFRLVDNSRPTLVIRNADSLPPECYMTEVVKKLDRAKVEEYIKAGVIGPDVAEYERGNHLRIT